MITIKTDTAKYKPEYVGMIVYSAYWHTYSLILNVNGSIVAELDSFGEINHCNKHSVREHYTALCYGDKLLTVEEFYEQIHLDDGQRR